MKFFLWEKVAIMESTIGKFSKMSEKKTNLAKGEKCDEWPTFSKIWPKLRDNNFVQGIPYLEETSVEAYLTRRQKKVADNRPSPLNQIVNDLTNYCDCLAVSLKELVYVNDFERELSESVKTVTDLRVMESLDILAACKNIINFDFPESEFRPAFINSKKSSEFSLSAY